MIIADFARHVDTDEERVLSAWQERMSSNDLDGELLL